MECAAFGASGGDGAGRVKKKPAPWNGTVRSALQGSLDLPHDDEVDELSGAFTELVAGTSEVVAAQVVSRERVGRLLG